MKIARVFPRITNATPKDDLCFFSTPPLWRIDCDEVHISCTFTYDKPKAEWLAKQWRSQRYNVKIGGAAYDDNGGIFVKGRYLKDGYVITSRGCNNNCWFCSVPKREGSIRELPIVEGNDILDSNLLQCSETHIKEVFKMLSRQKIRARFTGGLEARIFQHWHADLLRTLKPKPLMFFAYDTPDDYIPLKRVADILNDFNYQNKCVYCLIGYKKDTFKKAEERLMQINNLNMTPFAMLYRDQSGIVSEEWKKFQRLWARPTIIRSRLAKQTTRAI
jgi:hypothetical protein